MVRRRTERWYARQALDCAKSAAELGEYDERDKHMRIVKTALANTGLGFPRVSTLLRAHGYSDFRRPEEDVASLNPLKRISIVLREISAKSKSERVVYLADHGDDPWFTLRFIPKHSEGRRAPSTSHELVRDGTDRSVAVFVDAPVVIAESSRVPEAYRADNNILGLGHIALVPDYNRQCIDHPRALYVPDSLAGRTAIDRWAHHVILAEKVGPEYEFAQQIAELDLDDWPR